MALPEKFTKPYDPTATEQPIYSKWEQSGYFNPDNLPEAGEPYCILMPPPNANGRLHAGHGSDLTLKDILIRYNRMKGKRALFLPGSDHAGFETQGVYEKKLQKEGRSRFGMEREQLYTKIYDFVMENKQFMEDDVRRLGISCDWSRKIFMLDENVIARVQQSFIELYNQGFIYRDRRSIHWNPKYQTSLSDIETAFEERKEPFYYFKYGPFTIGTSRPETKFGDKYVVMHPDDARYKEYEHGQQIEVEWIDGKITATIIKDEAADPEFGTGVMTITPWHDPVDFEIAKRHDLEYEQIIGWDGKLLDVAGEFAGMHITNARPQLVEKLKEKGLLERIDDTYVHSVRVCERTGAVIEPQVMDQWYMKMKPLADKAVAALDEGRYSFVTEQYEKIFRHWMDNIIDWNISRQIVWGIRIPAWFKHRGTEHEEIHIGHTPPSDDGWEQDTDTFDTWFSSGQWPLVTLGYPDGKDMEFYPTAVMEAGSDLVFKWIPRMLMFGLHFTEQVPFKDIYFHGMVLDAKGKKMSKSKGNVLSPVELADTFGTDATRMAFVIGNPPGSNMALSENKVKGYKHFANKIWNITRFILTHAKEIDTSIRPESLSDAEQKELDALHAMTKDVSAHIEEYRLDLAADRAYHYVWHTFADIIIEQSKDVFEGDDEVNKQKTAWKLMYMLTTCLKTLHPFMPFITEEIWQHLPHKDSDMLLIAPWPEA